MGKPLESQIDSVSVYRRGAIVTRVAELPADLASSISIGPLPLDLLDGSVRVSVDAPGYLRATDLRVAIDTPEPDEDLPPARPEDLQAAVRAVAKLRDQQDAIETERGRVEDLGVIARPEREDGAEPRPSPAAARLALLRLRETRTRAADDAHQKVGRELREAQRHLADLRERERRASTMRRAEPDEVRKRVDLTLHGERGEGPATLRVEYRMRAARWAPTYTLRLDDEGAERGTLEVRAVVAQRSGEDWSGVALTLSTAQLQGWAELPELPSLRIGRQQAQPKKSGWRPPPVGTDALFGDFDRVREEPQPVAVAAAPAPPEEIAMREEEQMFDLMEDAPSPPMIKAKAKQRSRRRPGPPAAAPMSGSAPMPQAPPPQALSASAAPMSRASKSAGLGAMLSGALEEGVSVFDGAPGGMTTLMLEEPTAESVDAAMLDYGRLRMPGVMDDGRGKLVLRTRRALHIEEIRELEVEVDLGAALRKVEERGAKLQATPLPMDCVAPAPSGFDYAYRAAGRLDAKSDGGFHNLALSRDAGDAKMHYVVVPRESRDAFRFVEMDNPLDAPLLDGPIDVYVGDDFLLTSRVREVPEGGVLRLGLGVEPRVKISRNARYAEESGGLIGGRLDLGHEIEVEVENLLPAEARVEIRERIPTLREGEDDIRVEEHDVSPAWSEWEPEEQPDLEGGRRWKVVVPTGEKVKLSAAYTVRIASKHELVGGNRRES